MAGAMAGAMRAVIYFALVAAARGTTISLTNPSFEGAGGWTPLATGDSELFAPVAGAKYATTAGGGSPMTQDAGVTLEAATMYTLSVYARSVNDSYPPLLPDSLTSGTHKEVIARVSLKASGTVVATKDVVVSAPQLNGVAAKDHPNAASDDGANVWLEGGYRMHTAERLFYQAVSARGGGVGGSARAASDDEHAKRPLLAAACDQHALRCRELREEYSTDSAPLPRSRPVAAGHPPRPRMRVHAGERRPDKRPLARRR